MNPDSFDQVVNRICAVDERYDPDAYFFLREALDHTVAELARIKDGRRQHVTGKELSFGIRDYTLAEYGPLALLVLTEWGLSETQDFGEIVYNLIEAGVMGKTASDNRKDFKGIYNFQDTFGRPFEPRHPDAFSKKNRR